MHSELRNRLLSIPLFELLTNCHAEADDCKALTSELFTNGDQLSIGPGPYSKIRHPKMSKRETGTLQTRLPSRAPLITIATHEACGTALILPSLQGNS